MTLGERLRVYLPDGVEQKVIAMSWIERVAATGAKPLSPATAPSRLSELLADDPQGVRAFFRDPRRANALFDVLIVPEADRMELRALAEPVLAGAPQPRLVVDLSDLGHDRATMDEAFAGSRLAFFGEDGVFPVALVLTEAQYDLLPRSFDRLKDRVAVERVRDAASGAAAAKRLAGDATCLVSRRPLVEIARWWALDIEEGRLVVEPEDGLRRVRQAGVIGVPVVEHPLTVTTGTCLDAAGGVEVPASGTARRRLVAALADEGSSASREEAWWRAAAAERLGVQATSTKRERIEEEVSALVEKLGMDVATGSAEEWDMRIARAARRPADPFAMRVGDTVRVLNPAKGTKSGGRLEVQRVTCAEPHLVTLETALRALSEDDLLDDPLLGALIHRLAGKDAQALKLLFHARAVLVYGGRVRPSVAEAADDPLGALRQLVANDPPGAQLRVRVAEAPRKYGSGHCSVELRPFVYPDGRMYYAAIKAARLLYGVPPVGDVLWRHGEQLVAVIPATGREGETRRGGYDSSSYAWDAAGSPPVLVDPNATAETWLDDIEASPFFGAPSGKRGWNAERHLPEPRAGHTWTVVAEPADLWLNADTQLALAWLALREALIAPRWIRVHDGTVLLQVGGGMAARIHVRRHGAADAPVRGAVRCTVRTVRNYNISVDEWRFDDLAAPVATHIAYTRGYESRISMLMPSIWLAGVGHAIDVGFIPAPMLPGAGTAHPAVSSATAGAVATIDGAAQADD